MMCAHYPLESLREAEANSSMGSDGISSRMRRAYSMPAAAHCMTAEAVSDVQVRVADREHRARDEQSSRVPRGRPNRKQSTTETVQHCRQQRSSRTQRHSLRFVHSETSARQQGCLLRPQYLEKQPPLLQPNKPTLCDKQVQKPGGDWEVGVEIMQEQRQHLRAVKRPQQETCCKAARTERVSQVDGEGLQTWSETSDPMENAEQWNVFCSLVEQQEIRLCATAFGCPGAATGQHSTVGTPSLVSGYAAIVPPSSPAAVCKVNIDAIATASDTSPSVVTAHGCDSYLEAAENVTTCGPPEEPSFAYTNISPERACSSCRVERSSDAAAAARPTPFQCRHEHTQATRRRAPHSHRNGTTLQKHSRQHQPFKQQCDRQCRRRPQPIQSQQQSRQQVSASPPELSLNRLLHPEAGGWSQQHQEQLRKDVMSALWLLSMRDRLLHEGTSKAHSPSTTPPQHRQKDVYKQHLQHSEALRKQRSSEHISQQKLHVELEEENLIGSIHKERGGAKEQQQQQRLEPHTTHGLQRSRGPCTNIKFFLRDVKTMQQRHEEQTRAAQQQFASGDTTEHHRKQNTDSVRRQLWHVEGGVNLQQYEKEMTDMKVLQKVRYQTKHQQRMIRPVQKKASARVKDDTTGVEEMSSSEHQSHIHTIVEQHSPPAPPKHKSAPQGIGLHLALTQQTQNKKTALLRQQLKQQVSLQCLQHNLYWPRGRLYVEQWTHERERNNQMHQQQQYARYSVDRQRRSVSLQGKEQSQESNNTTNLFVYQEQALPNQRQQEHRTQQREATVSIPKKCRVRRQHRIPQGHVKREEQQQEAQKAQEEGTQHMKLHQLQRKMHVFYRNSKRKRITSLLNADIYNARLRATLQALLTAQRAWFHTKRECFRPQRFRVLHLLGRGATGNVYLVEDRYSSTRKDEKTKRSCRRGTWSTSTLYALKVIAKSTLHAPVLRRRVLLERQVFVDLQRLRYIIQGWRLRQRRQQHQTTQHERKNSSKKQQQQHLFSEATQQCVRKVRMIPPLRVLKTSSCCVRLEASFQDTNNLYQILEYLPGGNLRDRINAALAAGEANTAPARIATVTVEYALKDTNSAAAPGGGPVQPSVAQGILSMKQMAEVTACSPAACSGKESDSAPASELITAALSAETANYRPGAATATLAQSVRIAESSANAESAAPGATSPTVSLETCAGVAIAEREGRSGKTKATAEPKIARVDSACSYRILPCAEVAAASSSDTARLVPAVHEGTHASKGQEAAPSIGGPEMNVARKGCKPVDRAVVVSDRGFCKVACMRESERKRIFAQIVCGVHTLHALGYVHRDIKPENVGFNAAGNAKLIDFGHCCRLARAWRDSQQHKQHYGQQLLFQEPREQLQQQFRRHRNQLQFTHHAGIQRLLLQAVHVPHRQKRLHQVRHVVRRHQQTRGPYQQQLRQRNLTGQRKEVNESVKTKVRGGCAGQVQSIRGNSSTTAVGLHGHSTRQKDAGVSDAMHREETRQIASMQKRIFASGLSYASQINHTRCACFHRCREGLTSSNSCVSPHEARSRAAPSTSSVTPTANIYASVPSTEDVTADGEPAARPASAGSLSAADESTAEISGARTAASAAAGTDGSLTADLQAASTFQKGVAMLAAAADSLVYKDRASALGLQNACSVLVSPCSCLASYCPSVAGTLQYMAPEVLLQQKCSFAADWWSVGVMLFECTYGFLPFCFPARSTGEPLRSRSTSFPGVFKEHVGNSCNISEPHYPQVALRKSCPVPSSVRTSTTNAHLHFPSKEPSSADAKSMLSRSRTAEALLQPPYTQTCRGMLAKHSETQFMQTKCNMQLLPSRMLTQESQLQPTSNMMDGLPTTTRVPDHLSPRQKPLLVPRSNMLLLWLLLKQRYEMGGFCPAFLHRAAIETKPAGRRDHHPHAHQKRTRRDREVAVQTAGEESALVENHHVAWAYWERVDHDTERGEAREQEVDCVTDNHVSQPVARAIRRGRVKALAGGRRMIRDNERPIVEEPRVGRSSLMLSLPKQQQHKVPETFQRLQERPMLPQRREKHRYQRKQQQHITEKQHGQQEQSQQEGEREQMKAQRLRQEMHSPQSNTQGRGVQEIEEDDDFEVSDACIEVMRNLLCESKKRWSFHQLSACAWLREFFYTNSSAAETAREQEQQHLQCHRSQQQQWAHVRSMPGLQTPCKEKNQRQRCQQHDAQSQCMRECCWQPQQTECTVDWQCLSSHQQNHKMQQAQHEVFVQKQHLSVEQQHVPTEQHSSARDLETFQMLQQQEAQMHGVSLKGMQQQQELEQWRYIQSHQLLCQDLRTQSQQQLLQRRRRVLKRTLLLQRHQQQEPVAHRKCSNGFRLDVRCRSPGGSQQRASQQHRRRGRCNSQILTDNRADSRPLHIAEAAVCGALPDEARDAPSMELPAAPSESVASQSEEPEPGWAATLTGQVRQMATTSSEKKPSEHFPKKMKLHGARWGGRAKLQRRTAGEMNKASSRTEKKKRGNLRGRMHIVDTEDDAGGGFRWKRCLHDCNTVGISCFHLSRINKAKTRAVVDRRSAWSGRQFCRYRRGSCPGLQSRSSSACTNNASPRHCMGSASSNVHSVTGSSAARRRGRRRDTHSCVSNWRSCGGISCQRSSLEHQGDSGSRSCGPVKRTTISKHRSCTSYSSNGCRLGSKRGSKRSKSTSISSKGSVSYCDKCSSSYSSWSGRSTHGITWCSNSISDHRLTSVSCMQPQCPENFRTSSASCQFHGYVHIPEYTFKRKELHLLLRLTRLHRRLRRLLQQHPAMDMQHADMHRRRRSAPGRKLTRKTGVTGAACV